MNNNHTIDRRIEAQKAAKEEKLMAWQSTKFQLAHSWFEQEKTQMQRRMARGAIHFCNFGENIGCEQNDERPVVVVSNNMVNSTSGNVLVVPLTKNLKFRSNRTKTDKPIPRFQSHYFLFRDKYDFLAFDSAAKTEEMTSVSKIRLKEHLGNLDEEDMKRIETRLKWTLGM